MCSKIEPCSGLIGTQVRIVFFNASWNISSELIRVYNPTDPGAGPWYGLSEPQ